ncbi:hypothetical protein ACFL5K_05790, partial [Gemmatimonadota bacterium]
NNAQTVKVDYQAIDFEEECLLPNMPETFFFQYLSFDIARQHELWLKGWESLSRKIDKTKNTIISMHGVLTGDYHHTAGTWSPIDFSNIITFNPTRIIILIDDIYACWHRTESRANNVEYKGRPKLEHLLEARRMEIFIGDFIASNLPVQPLTYIFAVRHPVSKLFRLLFTDRQYLITRYISIPISGPRRQLSRNETSGFNDVNEFLKKVERLDNDCQQSVSFCPLTIDELPLLKADQKDGKYIFSFSNRWDVHSFYEGELLVDDEELPETIDIPADQVKAAEGCIKSDVAYRDYKLVMQSRSLIAFNPWFEGEQTGGVRNEISLARTKYKPCHIFQDPIHDPNKEAYSKLILESSSLGYEATSKFIHFHDSLEDLFLHFKQGGL